MSELTDNPNKQPVKKSLVGEVGEVRKYPCRRYNDKPSTTRAKPVFLSSNNSSLLCVFSTLSKDILHSLLI